MVIPFSAESELKDLVEFKIEQAGPYASAAKPAKTAKENNVAQHAARRTVRVRGANDARVDGTADARVMARGSMSEARLVRGSGSRRQVARADHAPPSRVFSGPISNFLLCASGGGGGGGVSGGGYDDVVVVVVRVPVSFLIQALGSEDFMIRFHSVYEKLNQALEGIPYTEIGISEKVKEQVELMRMQLRRAKMRTETQDMEVAMDMMVLLSTKDERNADSASIERLANKLALHTIEDLRVETIAVRKLVKERAQNTEANQQIINLLSKCKQIAGVEDTSVHDDPAVPKALAKCPSLAVAIPNEFLCPVTLEIMTDPVIVTTGQVNPYVAIKIF
ncbi:hypothetical protein HYC85_026026 [Camellia sinensis]|uniref:U-box domain-containing protein n=1 Tax=Camellia sinensis TaxID=4442 RepID=A0A7J7G313_CAMSI|nr:hypothetical protein HYC85_026026 [Camellia sinensis]